jgi:multidrug efflux pump subunit AcrA (membrane-fusion protein)
MTTLGERLTDDGPGAKDGGFPDLRAWCRHMIESLHGVVEAAVLETGATGFETRAAAPEGVTLRRAYHAALTEAADGQRGVVAPLGVEEDGIAEVLVLPIAVDGRRIFVLLGLRAMPPRQVELLMEHIQIASGWVVHLIAREDLEAARRQLDLQAQAFTISAEMLSSDTITAARQSLCVELAEAFGAARVALVSRGRGRRARLRAISGVVGFDRRTQLNDLTEQAATEALRQRRDLLWTRGEPVQTPLATVIPLSDTEAEMHGALVLHWTRLEAMPDLALWEPLWVMAQPVLDLQQRNARSLIGKATDDAARLMRYLLGPRHVWAKAAGVVVAALIAVLVFVEAPATLRADTVIDDPGLRAVAAPMEGTLLEVEVLPGDVVRRGETLARIDDTDLQLRRLELVARLEKLRAEEAIAQRERDLGAAAVARAEASEVRARLDLAEREIERITQQSLEAQAKAAEQSNKQGGGQGGNRAARRQAKKK